MTDPQAIEAAARAIDPSAWADDLHFHTPNMCIRRDNARHLASTAIAAYLEASDVGRDAERYRWLRDQMNKRSRHDPVIACTGDEDEGVMFGEEADAAIDAARGGEHG